MAEPGVLIRNAEVAGHGPSDLRLANGQIVEIGRALAGDTLLDAQGGAVIPGMIDHHLHLLATAAQIDSVQFDAIVDGDGLTRALHGAAATRAPDEWIRATGYHERMAGPLDRHALDRIVPDRPLRIQHQTGGLWMLNSAALARIGVQDWPDTMERDADGAPNGRLFRADAWLRARIGATPPPLAPLGRRLARHGITGVTDASVTNDAASAALLADAVRDGTLPVRLMLMSGGALAAPEDGAFLLGPVKILLDDDRLPPFEEVLAKIADARRWGRAVAAHCVTAGELALMLAAFEAAGSRPGDRIEHGGVIPADAIPVLRALRLTVVTQSGFIDTRGDRYRALVDPAEQEDLYRCASLIAAGVPVAGSSDAPYGDLDPWRAMRAAVARRTAQGHPLVTGERVDAETALRLYLGSFADPGGAPRTIAVGQPADLCVLKAPLTDCLDALSDPVAATLVDGKLTYRA